MKLVDGKKMVGQKIAESINYNSDWDTYKSQNTKTCVPVQNAVCRTKGAGGAGFKREKINITDNGIPTNMLGLYTKTQQYTAACRKRCAANSCPGSFVLSKTRKSDGKRLHACYNCNPAKEGEKTDPLTFSADSRYNNLVKGMQICRERGAPVEITGLNYVSSIHEKKKEKKKLNHFKIILGLEAKINEIQDKLDFVTKWYDEAIRTKTASAARDASQLRAQISSLERSEETLISQLESCNKQVTAGDFGEVGDAELSEFDEDGFEEDGDTGGFFIEPSDNFPEEGRDPRLPSIQIPDIDDLPPIVHSAPIAATGGKQRPTQNTATGGQEGGTDPSLTVGRDGPKCGNETFKEYLFLRDQGDVAGCKQGVEPICMENEETGSSYWGCEGGKYDCSRMPSTRQHCPFGKVCNSGGWGGCLEPTGPTIADPTQAAEDDITKGKEGGLKTVGASQLVGASASPFG